MQKIADERTGAALNDVPDVAVSAIELLESEEDRLVFARVGDELLRRLDEQADERVVPRSWLIREILEAWDAQRATRDGEVRRDSADRLGRPAGRTLALAS